MMASNFILWLFLGLFGSEENKTQAIFGNCLKLKIKKQGQLDICFRQMETYRLFDWLKE